HATLQHLLSLLRKPVEIPACPASLKTEANSEFGEENFKAAVLRAQQYILDGDIMQVVLSQRMSQPYYASPLALYRALRS
ncbi:MAG: anthranilate synthase component I, partial [Methylotenera sp.]